MPDTTLPDRRLFERSCRVSYFPAAEHPPRRSRPRVKSTESGHEGLEGGIAVGYHGRSRGPDDLWQ